MIYCFNCGKEAPDSSKFCPSCGTKLILKENNEKLDTECQKSQENLDNMECCAMEQSQDEVQENVEKTTQDEVFLEEKKKPGLKKSILSMIFGALSADFAICTFMPLIFFMFLIPCLIFRSISKKRYDEYIAEGGESNGFMKASHAMRRGAGIVLIPALIFSIFYTLIFVLLIIGIFD